MHGLCNVHLIHQNNEMKSSNSSQALAPSVGTSKSGTHYSVEHRVIMDSSGVRVQITRFVKIGNDDDDDVDDVDNSNLVDEGAFDFVSEVEKMFRAMSDDSADDSETDPNPDGVNPNMLPGGHDGRPSDIRSLEGHLDEHDRVQMKLMDDGMAKDPEHARIHRSGEHGWETSTAVVSATHVIKPRVDVKRSSLPPRSVFAKLAPSRDRYTILRDEL